MSAPQTDLNAAALTEPGARGLVRVVGGAGTGKTGLLIRVAAAHIASGVQPESVLLLTGSARLGTEARAAITTQLLATGRRAVREPLVRTVHSYAFAVLRLAASRTGAPPPRLITGAEQDGIIRELLAGDVQDGESASVAWPAALRPALLTAGFAAELRDLMARCTERGIDPIALQRLGRTSGRQEWLAAGQFAQAYEQIMLLRAAVGMAAPNATVPALGAAELVGAALEAFGADPELLAAERARIRVLLVDDAQHLDPQAARLVRVLAGGTDLTVIAGDPNQAVFGYRGADPALLRPTDGAVVITLTESHRCPPAVARAINGIARRLPGPAGPELQGVEGRPGTVRVQIAATPHAEAAVIADALRRAHLVDGVPWSRMAVIVRSVSRVGAALARSLTGAGVPVEPAAAGAPPAEQPAVRALLAVLAATAEGVDDDRALLLLTGPIGRVDPVTLRRLRRALRSNALSDDGAQAPRELADPLVQALASAPSALAADLDRPLRRVRAVLAAARKSADAGHDPRHTLWQAWHACGLQQRWLASSERGGAAGAQADRDLDAVTTLFDIADQYVDRTAGASLRGLIDHVEALTLPAPTREARPAVDAVAVLSVHAAIGREFEFVALAGLQDGLWPNTIPRGGVLATQHLVDVLDGVAAADETVSTTAPLLAEERRLLLAAMGRTSADLLVTAVDSDAGDQSMLPSPFCVELAALSTDSAPAEPVRAPRVLSAAAVVGRLRGVVCAPGETVDDATRACAATQLARLAAAGVPGADPRQWYGMAPVSSADPLWCSDGGDDGDDGDDGVVTLSPSTLQILTDCPLRWLLERHGGTDGRDVRSAIGSLVHALVAGPAAGIELMDGELQSCWEHLPFDAPWHSDNELRRHRAMLAAFAQWRSDTRHELTEVGTEVDVDGAVAPGDGDSPAVRVRGRVDRLERDSEGRLVVVDIKTGKSPVTKDDAQRHAQLAFYQLAIAEGVLAQGEQPGGGRLVYLGKIGAAGATEREQDALTGDTRAEWSERVRLAAAATQGPSFPARINEGCAHCPVASSCPAQASGGERR